MAEYARVISGFPGVGKTRLSKDNRFKVLDSDSSKFSWIYNEDGTKDRNPDFPNNYITHIKDNLEFADIILVSSHKDVRKALIENEIEFALVYPNISLKFEYLDRYKERGDTEEFINMMDSNWDQFVKECMLETDCTLLELKSGDFLSDYFEDKLPSSMEILAYVKTLADEKGLEVFLFEKEELKEYYDFPEGVAVAVIASNKDNAICNLKAKRYSWVLE